MQDILELIPDLFSSKSDHRSPSYSHLKARPAPWGSIGTSYKLFKDLVRSLYGGPGGGPGGPGGSPGGLGDGPGGPRLLKSLLRPY